MKSISSYRWLALIALITTIPFLVIININIFETIEDYFSMYIQNNDIYLFVMLQQNICLFVLFLIFTILIIIFSLLFFLNTWQKYHITKIAVTSLIFFSAFLFPFYYFIRSIILTAIYTYIVQIIFSCIAVISIISIYIFILIKEIKKLKSSNPTSPD